MKKLPIELKVDCLALSALKQIKANNYDGQFAKIGLWNNWTI